MNRVWKISLWALLFIGAFAALVVPRPSPTRSLIPIPLESASRGLGSYDASQPIDLQFDIGASRVFEFWSQAKVPTKLKELQFPITVADELGDCQVRLSIQNQPDSKGVFSVQPCRDIRTKGEGHFFFAEALPEHPFVAVLNIENADNLNSNQKQIHFWGVETVGLDVGFWPEAKTTRTLNNLQVLKEFLAERPIQIVSFLFLCLLALTAFVIRLRTNHFASLGLMLVCALGAQNILAPKMSGHDETAHLTMLHEALLKEIEPLNKTPNAVTLPTVAEFNQSSFELMKSSGFFLLHNVPPQDPNLCPHHTAVRYCGQTDKPLALYGFYASVLKLFPVEYIASQMKSQPARTLTSFGGIVSWLWLGLTLLLIWLIFGSWVARKIVLFVPIFGGFLGQFDSLTNDIPVYCLGLYMMGLVLFLQAPAESLRRWLGLMGGVAFSYWTLGFDDTPLGAFPILALCCFASFLSVFSKNHPQSATRTTSHWKTFGAGILVTVFLLSVFAISIRYLATDTIRFFGGLEGIRTQLQHAYLIEKFNGIYLHQMLEFTMFNIRSVLGSFVWGHEFFPKWYYLAGCAWMAFGGCLSYWQMALDSRGKSLAMIQKSLFVGGLLCCFLFAIFAVGSFHSISENQGMNESFLKIRFFGPVASGFFFLAVGGAMRSEIKWEMFESAGFILAIVSLLLMPGVYLLPAM